MKRPKLKVQEKTNPNAISTTAKLRNIAQRIKEVMGEIFLKNTPYFTLDHAEDIIVLRVRLYTKSTSFSSERVFQCARFSHHCKFQHRFNIKVKMCSCSLHIMCTCIHNSLSLQQMHCNTL